MMKYKAEHEKKHPSKGEALTKKWKEFEEKQKQLQKMKAEKEAEEARKKRKFNTVTLIWI